MCNIRENLALLDDDMAIQAKLQERHDKGVEFLRKAIVLWQAIESPDNGQSS